MKCLQFLQICIINYAPSHQFEIHYTQLLSICQYSIIECAIVKPIERSGNIMNYRDRLRSLREDSDLTQAQIGNVLQKSQQGYNHIEAGRAELKIDDLMKLCQFYDVSADYIIGLTDKKKSYK